MKIQCQECMKSFDELEVNMVDYDLDLCIECEKKEKGEIKMKTSEKINRIYEIMISMVEDHEKDNYIASLIDITAMPFHMSLDEMASEVYAWSERVHELEKEQPDVNAIEMVTDNRLATFYDDPNAYLMIKSGKTRKDICLFANGFYIMTDCASFCTTLDIIMYLCSSAFTDGNEGSSTDCIGEYLEWMKQPTV